LLSGVIGAMQNMYLKKSVAFSFAELCEDVTGNGRVYVKVMK
jgi:hypothetical protein